MSSDEGVIEDHDIEELTMSAYTPTTTQHATTPTETAVRRTGRTRRGRRILLAAAAAGPAFAVIGATEALVRDGFDPTRHSWSLLANGDWGWVHQVLMISTGLLTVAGGVALRRHLTVREVPWLVAAYGGFVALAGVFKADAMEGFPAGTPAGPPETISVSGLLHLATGGVAFLCLIAACLILGRRLRRHGSAWGRASIAVGVFYLVAFAGIGTGAGSTAIILTFVAAVMAGWAWLTLVFLAVRAGGLETED